MCQVTDVFSISDTGYIWRGWELQSEVDDDGEVCQHTEYEGSGTQCWCTEHLCNSHLCEECFDTTPVTTTTTTTADATTTTTTVATTQTTTQPPPSKGKLN
ncbi:unnamed protein product [Meganyctiphanes norvegica]|uniref:Uncharacterized protein n=1 Tax=Meganyctiphanes norvegica TaxID=48144 RepID=A0AAV2S4P6_MEGNR